MTTKSKTAADARIGTRRAIRERNALLGAMRSSFVETQTFLRAGRYLAALCSSLPTRNGWTIAEWAGERSPDGMQRLLSRASWDEGTVMSQVRRHAVAGLDQAAARWRRPRMTVGALDETGQAKHGECTAGVKRQYMGCEGRVANGINTVHLAYVRSRTGHALIGARQWIPAEHLRDPVKCQVMGLPAGMRFRTKGQLAIDVLTEAYGDGVAFDFACGDEVYGSCTELREFLEEREQAYVLRIPSNFMITLGDGTRLTCADATKKLMTGKRGAPRWEERSAGKGSKGERRYAWAHIATSSPRHSLLARRHLKTGELAFHWCYAPEGRLATMPVLIRAAGLRWPVEESFEFAKDYFGLDQCQARLYHAIRRHLVLVMAALAICAVTAAWLRKTTDTQVPRPTSPGQPPPEDPGLVPLSVREVKRLLAAALQPPRQPWLANHWLHWRRRHQALARFLHWRTRLERDYQQAS